MFKQLMLSASASLALTAVNPAVAQNQDQKADESYSKSKREYSKTGADKQNWDDKRATKSKQSDGMKMSDAGEGGQDATRSDANGSYTQDEIDGIMTLVTTTSRPIVQVGNDAVLTDSAYTLKRLRDADIYNAEGEEIADVEDLVINRGRVESIVLNFDGFLSLGEKQVAVPLDQFDMQMRDGDHTLTFNGDQAAFENMPDFGDNEGADRLTANDLIGKDLTSSQSGDADTDGFGETLNQPYMDDAILSVDGTITLAVIEYGGVLGFGEKAALVPFDRVDIRQSADDDELTLSMGPRDISTATSFFYSVDDLENSGAMSGRDEEAGTMDGNRMEPDKEQKSRMDENKSTKKPNKQNEKSDYDDPDNPR